MAKLLIYLMSLRGLGEWAWRTTLQSQNSLQLEGLKFQFSFISALLEVRCDRKDNIVLLLNNSWIINWHRLIGQFFGNLTKALLVQIQGLDITLFLVNLKS
jgi:hypothetical protein